MYKSSQYKSGDNCMNKAHHCWGYGKCLCTRVHNIKIGIKTIAWIKHMNKAHHCWGYGKCLCTRVHNIKVAWIKTIAWIKHITVEVMVNAYVQEFTI